MILLPSLSCPQVSCLLLLMTAAVPTFVEKVRTLTQGDFFAQGCLESLDGIGICSYFAALEIRSRELETQSPKGDKALRKAVCP